MNEVMKVLVHDLGFEPIEDYYDAYDLYKYIMFERIEDGSRHVVVLEDHRDDPNVKDWLIFSELTDAEIDWYGNKISAPYPLTLSEIKAFENFIKEFEKGANGG